MLCEFRGRLLGNAAVDRLLARVVDAAREDGLLKARGRQRTDSTHVLAAIRSLNRVELVAETLRAALNDIAVVAPDWLRAFAPSDWHERYDKRVEERGYLKTAPSATLTSRSQRRRLPASRQAGQVGRARRTPRRCPSSGRYAAYGRGTSSGPRAARTGADGTAAPGCGRCGAAAPATGQSCPTTQRPGYRTKASTTWTGYMVHFTETCDPEAPRLVVHADTTPANVHDALRTAPIHAALAGKGMTPSEHLVDSLTSARTTSSPPASSIA